MGSDAAQHLWFDSALLPDGWARRVRLEGRKGRIHALATGVDPQPTDERHAVAIAGLPNLHSHAFQRALAGLTERRGPAGDTFWTWRELMYRFVERVDPEQLEAITALAFAEMLEAGFTRVGEFHYLHRDPRGGAYEEPGELAGRVVAAAERTGIALTLLPSFYAHGGFGGREPSPRQRRFLTDPEQFARILDFCRGASRALPGARVGVAPHSLRAVTPQELRLIAGLAPEGPIHLHICEQAREVEESLAWCGLRPIELLLESVALDPRWCLVHATHAGAAELERVAAAGAVVGLCPITEASLGDGIFQASAFHARGGRLGIGTDSNVLIDAAGELRGLEYSQRLEQRARNVFAGEEGRSSGRMLFEAALAGGAQALAGSAAPEPCGIAPGAMLDIVSLDLEHPALIERGDDEILDSWIFSAGREAVDCVWRAGEKVVSGGRHRRREALLADYRAALRTLRE
jgi:formimidoylglutamate deiminase